MDILGFVLWITFIKMWDNFQFFVGNWEKFVYFNIINKNLTLPRCFASGGCPRTLLLRNKKIVNKIFFKKYFKKLCFF
ncbi:hypothetical protein PEPMIC_00919 [Parvimonas micra ATCC 33270]|uniref:Uncharacterized protein n=1 Tax=Parvimonas micra ATCC 33270 TaxID=411465 RepID=A8SLA3_9FIRM|nr:hypothetical protein PEPMIC_00919 [Parvimonas micra ATCC 33270]